ncbi:MAG: MFS transporter [Gammaproteobacteria bacterium]|nr:MFS transporter [Gammaproteobacteria bacterium]
MERSGSPVPYWRLSGFYLFYFSAIGALIPYWGLYLQSIGFSAAEIGELLAVLMATKIVAPNVWGWIADHRGERMVIVRLASLAAAVAFSGVFLGTGYWWLVLVMVVFSFFWNAALPQFEATTLTHLGKLVHRYTSIRLWGSVGFVLAVAVLGPVLDQYGVAILPWVIVALMAGIWLSSITVPERALDHQTMIQEPLRRVLRRPVVLALLASCLLMQMSHGPYYSFFSIYLEDYGYSRGVIGQLWALGVIAEVALFMAMPRLLSRIGLRTLFLLSFALTTLRWVLIALFPLMLPMLIVAQTLHAASFGIYHAVAIQLIHRHFAGRHQGRGQAIYSSLSFGVGGAIGSLMAGYAWEGVGGMTTYLSAAVASLAGLVIVWFWIGEENAS